MEDLSNRVPFVQMGIGLGKSPQAGDGLQCMYATGHLGSVKVNFLVNPGCLHNMLSKVIFHRLPDAVKKGLDIGMLRFTLLLSILEIIISKPFRFLSISFYSCET